MGFWSALAAGAMKMAPTIMNSIDASKNRRTQKMAMLGGVRIRAHDARKAGIHPLAALGAQMFNPQPIRADYSGIAQFGKDISDRDLKLKQLDLLDAQIKNIQADTAEKLGQGVDTVTDPKRLTPEASTGIEAGVAAQMKYERSPEGYFYLIARDNEAYSDEAPITTRALFLWDQGKRVAIVKRIQSDWDNPSLAYEKKLWLASRPPARKGLINLWVPNRGMWREFPLNDKTKGKIFAPGTYRTYQPRGKKRGKNYDQIFGDTNVGF